MAADLDLLARVQRLEDIEAIKQLKHRYFRSIDMADIETLATLFTEDVEVDYRGASYHWQVQGRDNLVAAVAEAFNAQVIACHTGHHPEIAVTAPDAAEGLWYLTDTMVDFARGVTTAGSALYRDAYVKVGGEWRIRRTTYRRIYEQVETFSDPPNITFSHLAIFGRSNGETGA